MRFFLLTILCYCNLSVFAQTDSSLPKTISINNPKIQTTAPAKPRANNLISPATLIKKNVDSVVLNQAAIDSLKQLIILDSSTIVQQNDSIILANRVKNNYTLLQTNPILKNDNVTYQLTNFKNYNSKDFLFYLLLTVVFMVALVRALFPKYLKNIFDIFFQPSFRQRQTREQLTQEYFATLLLNILFLLSTSIFVTLISSNQFQTNKQFWQFLFATFLILSIIYITKYSFTKFVGWIFHQQEVAESYNFFVFLINKIIGVVLAPLIFLISYSSTELKQLSLSFAFITIALLLFYRFVKAINSLRRLLKVSTFHFFIYFCSVEILPLFILYKAIGKYIGNGI